MPRWTQSLRRWSCRPGRCRRAPSGSRCSAIGSAITSRARHARRAATTAPEAAAATPCFFVVGHGRSGTTYLARLLHAAENALVLHEPEQADNYAAHLARLDSAAADEYVANYRGQIVLRRQAESDHELYGEVNSHLRLHAKSLRSFFPAAQFLVLERELHEVVRSMMSRNLWMLYGLLRRKPAIADDDPALRTIDFRRLLRDEPEIARLALATWYVLHDKKAYRDVACSVLRFERLVREPGYVARHVLEPLGLRLSRAKAGAVDRAENATTSHKMPPWQDWTARQRGVFESVVRSMPDTA